VPQLCLDIVFSVLGHCAVNDFYWEVKVNSLDFWNHVICRQFTHQGMIDGTFPTVTFSKEHKKIITLTEKEIHLRLHKVLNELSLRGCLGILVACLQDCDLEVIRKAIKIVDKIMGYLNKYGFMKYYQKIKKNEPNVGAIPIIDINYADFRKPEVKKEVNTRNNADSYKTVNVSLCSDNGELNRDDGYEDITCNGDIVIDSILQTDDMTLLSSFYNKNLNIEYSPPELGHIDYDLFKKFAAVTSDDFLNVVTTTDFAKLVQDKSEWLQHTETFSTLLDDMLRSMGNDDDIDLDCY